MLLAGVLASTSAHAIEKQHHIGLAPALGILKIDGKSTASAGFGGAVHYAYGLTDQFNLSLHGGSVVVAANQEQDWPHSPRNRPATVDHVAAGVGYVIDILRWVPYVDVHVAAYRLAGGTVDGSLFLPGAQLGGGIDYQLSRRYALGISAKQHLLFTKLDTYPSYTTVLLRFEYMWGY